MSRLPEAVRGCPSNVGIGYDPEVPVVWQHSRGSDVQPRVRADLEKELALHADQWFVRIAHDYVNMPGTRQRPEERVPSGYDALEMIASFVVSSGTAAQVECVRIGRIGAAQHVRVEPSGIGLPDVERRVCNPSQSVDAVTVPLIRQGLAAFVVRAEPAAPRAHLVDIGDRAMASAVG